VTNLHQTSYFNTPRSHASCRVRATGYAVGRVFYPRSFMEHFAFTIDGGPKGCGGDV